MLANQKNPLVIASWRSMISELKAAGYTATYVSAQIGESRSAIHRWFSNTNQNKIPRYPLFSKMLRFYSYHKNPMGLSKKPSRRRIR